MFIKNGDTVTRFLLEPIQPWLNDPSITEIVFNRPGEVAIERHGRWEWHDVAMTFDDLDTLGIVAAEALGKRFDPEHPICMTQLPDGQRLTLVRPPAVADGAISLTIRLPSRNNPTTRDPGFADQFLDTNTSTGSKPPYRDVELLRLYQAKDIVGFLELAVIKKRTILATGAPGSGKTSLLKRIMRHIPAEERLVTSEDTDEFGPLHLRNRVAMFFGSAGITAGACAEATLRMRPDRVALQELRGDEVWGFMRLLAAGYEGGFTSCHAQDGQPFVPLILMAKQTDEGRTMSTEELEKYFKQFIDIVVYCKCETTERGKIFTNPSIWFKDAENA